MTIGNGRRSLLLLFLAGFGCTTLSALAKYQYCIGGPGRGLPFAMTHPGHGPERLEITYEGSAIEGGVFDLATPQEWRE